MDDGPRSESRGSTAHARRRGRGALGRHDKNQTVYNLDVAENRDFFVGQQGVLVHDSNFVKTGVGSIRRLTAEIGGS